MYFGESAADRPVGARVIGQDPSVWYSQIVIDKGTSAGVRRDHPVVGPDGLVGRVTAAAGNSAVVTLLTDHTTNVSARINETGVGGVSQVELFGTNADVSPLVVASVGLLAGSVPGACFGFAAGLFLDLALVQTVGLSSLLLVAIGYAAGRLREVRDPQGALVPLAVGAAATLVATAGYLIMQFLLGADPPMSFVLVREILATVLLNTIIAGLVHAIVRRWLLPALPEDPRRRRRRAYTTGGLSPLSRA